MMVLVVEDDPAQRALVTRVLERMGFAVTAVGSIAEAKHVARADLILADWLLADGTAEDLRGQGVPLVVLSGYERPEDWQGPWLVKPVHLEDLRRVVTTAIAEAGL